jgi:thiol peroxidase
MASIRKGANTLKGNPIDLAGPELKVGDKAPAFKLQGADLSEITLANSAGKTRIIATVPSLDTPVCNLETKKFNETASKNPELAVLTVSMDLPFAQKRWCGAEGASSVVCLSSHRDTAFGEAYGVLIVGGGFDRCLSRAIFVVDPDDKIKHVEYVGEVANEPNYDAAVKAALS